MGEAKAATYPRKTWWPLPDTRPTVYRSSKSRMGKKSDIKTSLSPQSFQRLWDHAGRGRHPVVRKPRSAASEPPRSLPLQRFPPSSAAGKQRSGAEDTQKVMSRLWRRRTILSSPPEWPQSICTSVSLSNSCAAKRQEAKLSS